MARSIRIEYRGAQYHVIARGNERRRIFYGVKDYELFLKTLKEACERFDLELLAYVLMPNHFHLYVETPQGNLSRAIGWLQTTFTVRYNRKKKRVGHLFQGRYKAQLVEDDAYGKQLIAYIHLNPIQRRKQGKLEQTGSWEELQKFPWSSHPGYLGKGLRGDLSINYKYLRFWGENEKASKSAYQSFLRNLVSKGETPDPLQSVKEGLLLGGETFCDMIKDMVSRKDGHEEKRNRYRWQCEERELKVRKLLAGITDKRIKIWALSRLAGVRNVDLAVEFGYRDGSSVHYVAKRLEQKSLDDFDLAAELGALRAKVVK